MVTPNEELLQYGMDRETRFEKYPKKRNIFLYTFRCVCSNIFRLPTYKLYQQTRAFVSCKMFRRIRKFKYTATLENI